MRDAVPIATPEAPPSAIGRIVGAIVSPDETFASIARLFVIGFAAAAKIKRGPAAGVIVTLWLLTVTIGVAWNAIS